MSPSVFRKRRVAVFLFFLGLIVSINIYLLNTAQDENSRNDRIPTMDTSEFLTTHQSRDTQEPVKNIVFLRTSKTGSSTVANILMRYGDVNNLNFVYIPGDPSLAPVKLFPVKLVPKLVDGEEYNIVYNHARFNKTAFAQIMPKDTLYFTILRNPVKHIRSMFGYYNWPQKLGIVDQNPWEFFVDNLETPEMVDRMRELGLDYNLNLQVDQLGLQRKHMNNITKVRESVAKWTQEFDLVMITEYFDESLILLKRLLKWTMEDVIYLKIRTQKISYNPLNEVQNERIRKQSKPTEILYNHFNQTLWEKLRKQDDSFWLEVKELRERNVELERNCVVPKTATQRGRYTGYFFKVRENAENKILCNRMAVFSGPYQVYLTKKQLAIIRNERLRKFHVFIPKNFWTQPSWSPHEGYKKDEDIYQRVCEDSRETFQDCCRQVTEYIEQYKYKYENDKTWNG